MARSHLETQIGKFKLDDLLILNATLSRELFLKGHAFEDVEVQVNRGTFTQKVIQYLTGWGLSDLSYLAIMNSNNYRSTIPNRGDVILLNNLLGEYTNNLAQQRMEVLEKADVKAHILFGLSQKQFWYQEIAGNRKLINNFLRYFILLDQIPSKYFPKRTQPKSDLMRLTGFNIRDFSQLILAVWAYVLTTSVVLRITVSKDLKEVIPLWTEDNTYKCIRVFTGDYEFYRKPWHANNPLFFKPIIETANNMFIVSNVFILARKFYEGIYWLIREDYKAQNSQTFTNDFGDYYEKYIEEILTYYLQQHPFEKVKKGKGRQADWLIHTKNYLLVIEQKSCLMTVALKEEYPSMPTLDKYLEKFAEAYMQIENTASGLEEKGKKIVKLVLHFEKFYVAEAVLKERVNKLCSGQVKDVSNYFLIDTGVFEGLIQALSEDENVFNKIVEKKIEYESRLPPGEGREFKHIINTYYKTRSIKYLDNYKHYFDRLFGDLKEECDR